MAIFTHDKSEYALSARFEVESMPRITIVSQWYPPEQAPFGRMMQELAESLVSFGWDVTVITGFPNHPTGVVHDGYRKTWLQEEKVKGVRLCRVWLATSSKRTLIARVATFVSFTLLASWRLLRLSRPDVIFAVLQPLSVGITLPFVARLKRTPLVLNLQDLHPDAQIRLGMVRNPWVIRALRAIETRAYRNCAALTVICPQFRKHAIERGAEIDRVFVIENWVDTDRIRPEPDEGLAFRREVGLDAGDFVVLCAGTLGHVSGAAIIVEAARLLSGNSRIRFLVVGEGPMLGMMKERTARLGLTNVVFRPFQAESRLPALQNSGDISLVTLAPALGDLSVPSKVLAYLAAGRPVVASVPLHGETADLVRRASAGVIVTPGDADELAKVISSLASDAETVRRLGAAARTYAVEQLSRMGATQRYKSVFDRLCGIA